MKFEITDLIKRYPKKRPDLSSQYRKILADEYEKNREGKLGLVSRIANKLESWMHYQVSIGRNSGSILEVGAGTLNHLQYEVGFECYDIVEPFSELYQDKYDRLGNIRDCYVSLSDIPHDNKYDRIISIATLEHMTNLPLELEVISKLMKSTSALQIAIPSEGGFLWGLAWRLSTGVSFKIRTGLSYKNIMRHEHVNTSDEVIALVEYLFDDVKIKRFPFNSKHFSLYTYISAKRRVQRR